MLIGRGRFQIYPSFYFKILFVNMDNLGKIDLTFESKNDTLVYILVGM